jgi:hypothetical protein
VAEEFVDRGVSGAKERRPALDRLMKAAWAGQFQVVLVWRFDRFARSVKHLVAALETFRTLKVGFVSLQEQLDTTTPIGQAMFTIIGAMAQLERDAAAGYLGISLRTLLRWDAAGIIISSGQTPGGHRRFHHRDLARLRAAQRP